MKKIPLAFYSRTDVVSIAKELLGKIIVTNFDHQLTSARIVEIEAYIAFTDRASHSFNGKRTPRNEHMYGKPGTAYVYICYGLHHMMNIVTNDPGIPDAVLIRAAEPIRGRDVMCVRTGKKWPDTSITRGPGNVGKALGIVKQHSGYSLSGNRIHLIEDDFQLDAAQIGTSKRIGVESAGEGATLPYRFYLRGNRYVSGSNT